MCWHFFLLALTVVKVTGKSNFYSENYLTQHAMMQQSNLSLVKLTNRFENLTSSVDVTSMPSKATTVSTLTKKYVTALQVQLCK